MTAHPAGRGTAVDGDGGGADGVRAHCRARLHTPSGGARLHTPSGGARLHTPSAGGRLPVVLVALLACTRGDGNTVALPDQSTARRGDDPPVVINPESPVEYPATLYGRGIEGKVVLRLFVNETGRLDPDSTRLAESSGYPALDSAALAAVPSFRFAPALQNGAPVGATFLLPVHFRHPEAGGMTP